MQDALLLLAEKELTMHAYRSILATRTAHSAPRNAVMDPATCLCGDSPDMDAGRYPGGQWKGKVFWQVTCGCGRAGRRCLTESEAMTEWDDDMYAAKCGGRSNG